MGERLARRHVAPRPFTEQDLHPLGHRCVTRGVGGFTQDVESFVVMMLDVGATTGAVVERMAVGRKDGGDTFESSDAVERVEEGGEWVGGTGAKP